MKELVTKERATKERATKEQIERVIREAIDLLNGGTYVGIDVERIARIKQILAGLHNHIMSEPEKEKEKEKDDGESTSNCGMSR